jgi:hypothetical protein
LILFRDVLLHSIFNEIFNIIYKEKLPTSDGESDLVTANGISDDVSILLGNGNGTFGTANNFSVGGLPFSVAVGDFN